MATLRDTATVAPRWATPRTPGRRTYGAAVAKVAAAMGRPLQPWQRHIADVATELDDDGGWAYRTVVVTVQRQAGKTTLVGPVNMHRCLTRPRAKTWFTAQRRQDARDTWRDVAELVALGPMASLVTMRRSNGSEELAAANGSTFRVFAPSEDALHGKANELVTVDESWAFDAAQGAALQQAILPTFTTTGGQLWLPSTAGTGASTWLRSYVDRGRAAVESDQRRGIAYFEWSLQPDAAQVVTHALTELARNGYKLTPLLQAQLDTAIDLVMAAHPGQYVQRGAIMDAAMTMPPGEFLRAFGNVWTLTADRVITDHAWAACLDKALPQPDPGTLGLAFDVSVDRSHAAIGGVWRHGTHAAVDVVDERPGTSWLVERIEQLAQRWRVAEVGCDGVGPALDVADELDRRGVVRVRRTNGAEYFAACAGYLAAIEAGLLRHRGTGALDNAVANAARVEIGDRWKWSRRTSGGSIAGLVATTVALWCSDHRPPPPARPIVVAGRRAADSQRLIAPASGPLLLPARR